MSVNPVVDAEIETYCASHSTTEPPALAKVASATRATREQHGMMVGHLEGRFLEMLVHMTAATRVLEIGTFTGYSAMTMAAALPPHGKLITCEIDPDNAATARHNIEGSPWADRVEVRLGPALDTLATLDGPFEVVFIDADKAGYWEYFEAVLPLLADNGVIAVDNVLWKGRVLEGAEAEGADGDGPDGDTAVIRAFNNRLRDDLRVVCVMLPLRDGVTLVRRARPDESSGH